MEDLALQDGNLQLFTDVGLAHSNDDQDGGDGGDDQVDGACDDEGYYNCCLLGGYASNQLICKDTQRSEQQS